MSCILRVGKALGGSICCVLRWEIHFVVLCTLRAVPPTQFILIRVSFRGGVCSEEPTPRAAFARLSAHCAYRRVLSRIEYLIPNR